MYKIKDGPVFGGMEAPLSERQEKEGNKIGGVWLDIKVTADGVARRIWFGKAEVRKI